MEGVVGKMETQTVRKDFKQSKESSTDERG